jgi:hypothetical protein
MAADLVRRQVAVLFGTLKARNHRYSPQEIARPALVPT